MSSCVTLLLLLETSAYCSQFQLYMSTDIPLLAVALVNTTNPPPLIEFDNNSLVHWIWVSRWPRIHPLVAMEIVD
jgi:hypothetical protein